MPAITFHMSAIQWPCYCSIFSTYHWGEMCGALLVTCQRRKAIHHHEMPCPTQLRSSCCKILGYAWIIAPSIQQWMISPTFAISALSQASSACGSFHSSSLYSLSSTITLKKSHLCSQMEMEEVRDWAWKQTPVLLAPNFCILWRTNVTQWRKQKKHPAV